MANTVTGEIVANIGDTLTPWSFYIADFNGTVPDLDDYDSVEFRMWADASCPKTDVVAWTDSNVTVQPTKDFTADTATGVQGLYSVNHGLRTGMQVKLTTTGVMYSELATATRYFVVRVNGHNFWLSKLKSGSPISITTTSGSSGSQRFEILGHVQYQPQSGDVDAAGTFKGKIRIEDSSTYETFPSGTNDYIPITVGDNECDS
jgi:hypothetical protein